MEINALSRAGQAERAEALLEEMCFDYLDGKAFSKRTVTSNNILLVTWSKAKSRDAPQHTEAILERMARLHNSSLRIPSQIE